VIANADQEAEIGARGWAWGMGHDGRGGKCQYIGLIALDAFNQVTNFAAK